MPQSANQTRNKASTAYELLISQWPDFNQKLYLEAEKGISGYDSIIDYILDQGKSAWIDNIEPGVNGENESISDFRLLNVSNADIGELLSPNSLDGFVFSLFKEGVVPSYDESKMDVSAITGGKLNDLTLNTVFAPFLDLYSVVISNVVFNNSVLREAEIKNSDLKNISIIKSNIDGFLIDNSSVSNLKIFNSDFNFADDQVYDFLKRSDIENSKIEGSTLKNAKLNDVGINNSHFMNNEFLSTQQGETTLWEGAYVNKTEFIRCEFYVFFKNGCIFKDVVFDHSLFDKPSVSTYGAIALGGIWQNCSFNNAQMSNIEYRGKYYNCSFKNVSFADDQWLSGGRFIGCNFEGSNMDTHFATATDFKNAAAEVKNCVWVDGTVIN